MADLPENAAARGRVELREVSEADQGVRLDRWFRRHFPAVPHGRVEKLLRGGQIRVDGHRARADQRLEPGEVVRVPPLAEPEPAAKKPPQAPGAPVPADLAALRSWILYEDDAVIVLNKPPGLAVQGGSGTRRHLDGMLGLLSRSGERPRLVHRLDKDTSGVLILARSAAAAAFLTRAFRDRAASKLYWAIVVGVPEVAQGRIDLPLAKKPGPAGERMEAIEVGERAITDYAVIERIGKHAAWLELDPAHRPHPPASRPLRRHGHADPGRRQVRRPRCLPQGRRRHPRPSPPRPQADRAAPRGRAAHRRGAAAGAHAPGVAAVRAERAGGDAAAAACRGGGRLSPGAGETPSSAPAAR